MCKKKTKKAYEFYLNNLYSDIYSVEQAIDAFVYLTNRSRGKTATLKRIELAHANRELGTVLRSLDLTAFNTGFYDWQSNSNSPA